MAKFIRHKGASCPVNEFVVVTVIEENLNQVSGVAKCFDWSGTSFDGNGVYCWSLGIASLHGEQTVH